MLLVGFVIPGQGRNNSIDLGIIDNKPAQVYLPTANLAPGLGRRSLRAGEIARTSAVHARYIRTLIRNSPSPGHGRFSRCDRDYFPGRPSIDERRDGPSLRVAATYLRALQLRAPATKVQGRPTQPAPRAPDSARYTEAPASLPGMANDLQPRRAQFDAEVRELRPLGGHRSRLIKQRTQARNRLRAVLIAHNLFPPPGEAFGPANRGWWEGLDLPASEKLRVRQDLSILDSLEPLIKEVEAELVRQSSLEPWAEQAAFLVQLPGIGVHSAMMLLGAIGDIRRFDAAHKLVGYAGPGARMHSSGEENYGGRITKQGRRDLRSTMVEAARVQWEAIPTGWSCSNVWPSALASPRPLWPSPASSC